MKIILNGLLGMERVLVTHDIDFLVLANEIHEHSGIVYAKHYKATPGGWVKALIDLHTRLSAEEMFNRVEYLKLG